MKQLDSLEAEPRAFPVPTGSTRREFAVADRVPAERRELAIAAAHISPPPYIRAELGERPRAPSVRWRAGRSGAGSRWPVPSVIPAVLLPQPVTGHHVIDGKRDHDRQDDD